jgi:acyl-CoA oxidase
MVGQLVSTSNKACPSFTAARKPSSNLYLIPQLPSHLHMKKKKTANTTSVIRSSAFQLAQALTIAARYSTVRLQGNKLSRSSIGTPIIAYKQQHSRLLTLISKSYANIFASHSVASIYSTLAHLEKQGNHSTLPYVHMLMCGLKAWTSQTAADGAEEARKMCGGHGYMALSGLPDIVASVTATCTFEGENFVMWGQVARYLVKGMDLTVLPQDMTYMDSFCPQSKPCKITASGKEFVSHKVLLDLFKQRAASLTYEAHALVKKEENKGKSREVALDTHALPLLAAGRAHIEVFILQSCIEQLSILPTTTSPAIITVLNRLVSLFGLSTIASPFSPFSSSFLTSKTITASQLGQMREQIDGLEEVLLPDSIALTDAWSFTDGCLRSAIGCKDGDVYRRIMEWTRQLPINVEAAENGGIFKKGWEEVIKGFLARDLSFKAKL